MKDKVFVDFGQVMDEIFEDLGNAFSQGFHKGFGFTWDDNIDFYPAYSYPPTNIYLTQEKSLVFQFALAGADPQKIELEFVGDYMILSADFCSNEPSDEVKYFKRRLKLKPIKNQKYYVPADKFSREDVQASLKNGILEVQVKANTVSSEAEPIKVKIKMED